MIRRRSFFRNPIYRRILRHASISTVYRSYAFANELLSQEAYAPSWLSYQPVVNGEGGVETPHELGAMETAPAGTQAGEAQRPVSQPEMPVQRAPDVESGKMERQPADRPAQVSEARKSGRLKLPPILRKLQERLAPARKAEASPREAPAVPPAVESKPAALPPSPAPVLRAISPEQPARPMPVEPAIPPIQAQPVAPITQEPPVSPPAARIPQASPAAPQPPAAAAAQQSGDASWRRLQAIMRKHEEKRAGEGAQEAAQVSPSDQTQEAKPAIREGIQRKEAPARPSEPARKAAGPPPRPGGEAPAPADSEIDDTQMIYPEQIEEPGSLQAEPLEAAWPVQRKETKLPQQKGAPPASAGSNTPSSSPPISADEEEVLRQVVGQAKTGQPTDSHVEVILPRSPRPASVGRQKPAPTTSPPPVDEQAASGVSDAGEGAASTPIEDISASLEPSISAAPPGMTQRTPETITHEEPGPGERPPETEGLTSSMPSVEAAPVDLVPTEIGPLPADLWRLIDQPLPGAVPDEGYPEEEGPQTGPINLSAEAASPQPVAGGSKSEIPQAQPPIAQSPPEMDRVQTQAGRTRPPVVQTPSTVQRLPAEPQVIQPERGGEHPPAASADRDPQAGSRLAVTQESYIYERPALTETIPVDHITYPPVIQRAEGAEPTQPAAPSPAAESEEAGGGQLQLTEAELNNLASQVYTEIRHKLSLEQERVRRGRF